MRDFPNGGLKSFLKNLQRTKMLMKNCVIYEKADYNFRNSFDFVSNTTS